jgi:flagellar basal body rod protein FlgG
MCVQPFLQSLVALQRRQFGTDGECAHGVACQVHAQFPGAIFGVQRSQARSGVDVDREVAAMVELQNAYTVNARVVATIQAMWDALFGAVR